MSRFSTCVCVCVCVLNRMHLASGVYCIEKWISLEIVEICDFVLKNVSISTEVNACIALPCPCHGSALLSSPFPFIILSFLCVSPISDCVAAVFSSLPPLCFGQPRAFDCSVQGVQENALHCCIAEGQPKCSHLSPASASACPCPCPCSSCLNASESPHPLPSPFSIPFPPTFLVFISSLLFSALLTFTSLPPKSPLHPFAYIFLMMMMMCNISLKLFFSSIELLTSRKAVEEEEECMCVVWKEDEYKLMSTQTFINGKLGIYRDQGWGI